MRSLRRLGGMMESRVPRVPRVGLPSTVQYSSRTDTVWRNASPARSVLSPRACVFHEYLHVVSVPLHAGLASSTGGIRGRTASRFRTVSGMFCSMRYPGRIPARWCCLVPPLEMPGEAGNIVLTSARSTTAAASHWSKRRSVLANLPFGLSFSQALTSGDDPECRRCCSAVLISRKRPVD